MNRNLAKLGGFLSTLLISQIVKGSIFDLSNPYFETVSTGEDIPNNTATAITQDKQGFLWIGTQYGLVRFDGYSFKRYSKDSQNPSSLVGNNIRTLWPHSNGQVWIGTSAGLSIYNPDSDSFINFNHSKEDPNSLVSHDVNSMVEDHRGGVWVGGTGGLNYLKPIENQSHQFEIEKNRLTQYPISSLTISQDKTLWLGTSKGLFYKKNNSDQPKLAFDLGPKKSNDRRQVIWSLFSGIDDRVWIGTVKHGAYWFYPEDAYKGKKLFEIPFDKNSPTALQGSFVYSITQPNNQEVWLATFGGGISIFDTAKNKIVKTIQNNPADPNSVPLNAIGPIFTDDSGIIWVGTWGKGICRTNSKNSAFRILRKNPDNPNSLTQNTTTSVLETTSGQIFVGTQGNGIDIIDPNIGVIDGIRPKSKQKDSGLKDGIISDIVQSDPNTIWIGTLSSGIYRYNLSTKKLIEINSLNGIPIHQARTLAVDGNWLWIGSENGLQRLNIRANSVSKFFVNRNGRKIINILKIGITKDKTVWVSTYDSLYVVLDDMQTLHEIKPNSENKNSLQGEPSKTFSIDSEDNIWVNTTVGTERLVEWNGKQATFELVYPTDPEDSPPSNFVEDKFGNFWSPHGYYNQEQKKTRWFTQYDGTDIGAIFIVARKRTKDGLILFSGSNGILVIDPSKYQEWDYQPMLQTTEIKIDNKSTSSVKKQLTLTADNSSFAVEFASLDYSGPKLNKFAYKLDGYDKEWIETNNAHSDHRVAKYTNLPPGKYNLMAKGTNRVGDWSVKTLSIPIIQLPAWYQTIWFKVFVGLILLGFGYGILEFRTRLLKQRTLLLQNLVDEKTRDIKSILVAIQQGILAIEDEKGNIGPEHSEYLKTIAGTEEITGHSFYDLIFKDSNFTQNEKSQIMTVISASVGQDELTFALNSHLLPREAKIDKDDTKSIYELDWNPIVKDSIVHKILLVIRDVTEIRSLEKESKKQRHEIEIIQEIINVPADRFDAMIEASYEFIAENRLIISQQSQFELESIQRLFRNMHTLKGLARSYNLRSLSDAAHIAEQYYSQVLNSKEWNTKKMISELDKAKKIVDSYSIVNTEKLGRSSHDSDILPVKISTLETNLEFLSSFRLSEFSAPRKSKLIKLKRLFTQLIKCPIEQVLTDQIEASASLARQLGKPAPLIKFNDPGFSINKNAHKLLNNVFTHLIRNAIDHGLEAPAERREKGKPEQGELKIILEEKQSHLQIKFSDDGRGLNLAKIYEKALEKGMIRESEHVSPEAVANLIFTSGFSTAKRISNISGRGVGMDAVRSFLDKENGSISVHVIDPSITHLTFAPVEFIITLPINFYQFMGDSQERLGA